MGRGLAAILSASGSGTNHTEELRELPVELIVPNPRQPRQRFDEESLKGLTRSRPAASFSQFSCARRREAPTS
jgi:ParB family chromosome partitioning protein